MTDQSRPATQTESPAPTGRRRLLQALAVGGVSAAVLPEKWVKPVIDTVIVPAHAQGSIVQITGIYSNNGVINGAAPGSFMERLANFVVPSAHAQEGPTTFPGAQCLSFDFSGNPVVAVRHADDRPGSIPQYRDESEDTQVFPDNRVQNVQVGQFFFSELAVTPAALTGRVTNTITNAFAYFSLGPGAECQSLNPNATVTQFDI